jgi:hypothetical protein
VFRKPKPRVAKLTDDSVYEDAREMIALADIYAEGILYRKGIDTIWTDTAVYRNTMWAFGELEEQDNG